MDTSTSRRNDTSAKSSTPTGHHVKESPLSDVDNSIAFESGADAVPLLTQAFVVVPIAFSLPIGFCWRVILISFYGTYYYYSYFFWFLGAPRSGPLWRFCATCLAHCVTLALLTALCISITPIHVVTPTLMDLWTPYVVHPALQMTKVMYDAGKLAEIDIFAIHGLGSNPDSAWTYRGNQSDVYWLRDLLPREEGLQNIRVVMVNHQTRWDSNTANVGLHEHASELLESIQSLHKGNPERPIIFIAHSFGGLLLKKALLLAKSRSKDVATMTKGVVFLGVPHRGTYAAIVASCLSCMSYFRGSSSAMLDLMAVDGTALLDLESEFYDAYVIQHHSREVQPYICDILELRPEMMGALNLGSIVRPRYGHLRHGRLIALDTDHRGLNKFQSGDDPNWHVFLRTLRQAYDHALQQFRPTENCPPIVEMPPEPAPTPCLVGSPYPPSPTTTTTDINTNTNTNTNSATAITNTTEPDILVLSGQGMPYLMGMATAACLWGLQELTASWLARDRNKHGSYLTTRTPKSAIYGGLLRAPLGYFLIWAIRKTFKGGTSLTAKILISNLIIAPIQNPIDLVAMALIAGARSYYQVRGNVKVGLRKVMLISWITSPICLILAQKFLSNQLWVPLFNLVPFITATYINTATKKRRLAALRLKHFGDRRAPQSGDHFSSFFGTKDPPCPPY